MFLVISIIVITFVICLYIYDNNKNSGGPPGPWNLPILGYLHKLDPNAPYLTLTQLAKKYGSIYRVKLGTMNAVVVSDAKLLKKIFMRDEALERPPLYTFELIFKGKGLVGTNGSLWKDQRKFVINFLRTAGASRTSANKQELQDKIQENVETFVEFVKSFGDHVIMNPTEAIAYYVTGISSILFLGKSYSYNDQKLKTMIHHMDQATNLSAIAGPLNFLPFLRFLPTFSKSVELLEKASDNARKLHRQIINEQQKTFSEDDTTQTNLIHAFLLEKSKSKSPEMYNLDQLEHLVGDMFGASTETTVNSLVWSILYLATHKEVQKKVRQELCEVLQGKSPVVADLQDLPYTQAALAEVARIRTIAPIAFPHYTSEDITVDDVKIGKDTMVMPLLWAIHMDPKLWKDPEEFCPERFLNEENKFFQPEAYLPFLTGKRMCFGEDLAKIVIFMLVATVLQNFEIEGCYANGAADFSPISGFTIVPKPQNVIFKKI